MASRTARPARTASALLAGGLLLAALAGCTDDPEPPDPAVAAADPTPRESPGGDAAEASEAADPSPSEAADAPDGVSGLACSGTSCSVTISGNAEVEVLGTPVTLAGVRDGRATIGIGDLTASCSVGERIEAGPLSLECTEVAGNSLTLTASLG